MAVDLTQPPGMRCFVRVRNAPGKLVLRGPPLVEEAGNSGTNDAGNPIHDENLSTGELSGLVQKRERVFHVPDPLQQRDRWRTLCAQQSDGAQVQGLLNVRQTRCELLQPRGEKL